MADCAPCRRPAWVGGGVLATVLVLTAPAPGAAGAYSRIPALSENQEVSITLWNGERLNGRFVGTVESPESAYVARYSAWRDSTKDEPRWPALGDSVWIRRVSDSTLHGRLRGFDQKAVLLSQMGLAGVRRIPIARLVALVDTAGREIPASRLKALSDQGLLPITTVMQVSIDSQTRFVAWQDIASVEPRVSRSQRTASFVPRLVLCVIALGVLASAIVAGSWQ